MSSAGTWYLVHLTFHQQKFPNYSRMARSRQSHLTPTAVCRLRLQTNLNFVNVVKAGDGIPAIAATAVSGPTPRRTCSTSVDGTALRPAIMLRDPNAEANDSQGRPSTASTTSPACSPARAAAESACTAMTSLRSTRIPTRAPHSSRSTCTRQATLPAVPYTYGLHTCGARGSRRGVQCDSAWRNRALDGPG